MGSLEVTGQSVSDYVYTEIQSISEFIKQTKKKYQLGDLDGYPNDPDWPKILQENNFYSCPLKKLDNWPNVHKWCEWQFGSEHYVWTGSTFWFETEQAQLLFMLTWG
jgi:hypothetical protein